MTENYPKCPECEGEAVAQGSTEKGKIYQCKNNHIYPKGNIEEKPVTPILKLYKFVPYKNITFEEVVSILESFQITVPENHEIFSNPKLEPLRKYFQEEVK